MAVSHLPPLGTEWIVDAHGCAPASLASRQTLETVFARIVTELGLTPVREAVWHVFPGTGGITGVLLLSESHLACHTFPETGLATFNLYCCRRAREWAWDKHLKELLAASEVSVRILARGATMPRTVVSRG